MGHGRVPVLCTRVICSRVDVCGQRFGWIVRTADSLVEKYVQPLTHGESARTVSEPTPKILIVD
jgi:hypothetical protein